MRVAADQLKEAILHPDPEMRDAAVAYFSTAFSPDPTLVPLVIQACARYGIENAFADYGFLDSLVHTDATVGWLIQQLASANPAPSVDEADRAYAFSYALANADASLLERHEDEIMALAQLVAESKTAISERIEFLARPAHELWQELEELCEDEDVESVADEDFARAGQLVAALARHADRFADKVLAILGDESGEHGQLTLAFAVRLAGKMKLAAAIAPLVEMLSTDDDLLCEEVEDALAEIGTDAVVVQLSNAYPQGEWDLRIPAAILLGRIHSDLSVQACVDWLHEEEDSEIRCLLLESLLRCFATEGIEPTRQFILSTQSDADILALRSALLPVCKLTGERFPEFDAWLEDDKAYRGQMSRESNGGSAWLDDGWTEEEDLEDDEERLLRPSETTFVHTEPRVGRNDPCPCGSGKKYKKCCISRKR